jgi:hypothetical protein
MIRDLANSEPPIVVAIAVPRDHIKGLEFC